MNQPEAQTKPADVARLPIPGLTVQILTFNEERHLSRCINSLGGIAERIQIIDSFSNDRTLSIAQEHGAVVYQNKWTNYAKQFNWGLDLIPSGTQWIMRLDADEVVTAELSAWLRDNLSNLPSRVEGLTVNRQIHFMGRFIRHGDIYPRKMLRLWRAGNGRCEERWMDEHIVVAGDVLDINHDIADINLNNLTWWINKHNHYATREAIDLLISEFHRGEEHDSSGPVKKTSGQASLYRWIKLKVYARIPAALRSLLYFVYRYILRLGFLDGWQGFVFHFLQGYWYRFLVDVKIWEVKKLASQENIKLAEVVKREYGYDIADQLKA